MKTQPAHLDFHLFCDYDFLTQGGNVLRVTAVIRRNGGEIEYKNLSHEGSPTVRVSRTQFQERVAKELGYKGSERK